MPASPALTGGRAKFLLCRFEGTRETMSNPGEADATPIASVQQLADYVAAGCKPKSEYRIGTEHEKFGFRWDTLTPPPYEPGGIGALLERMQQPGVWEPI